VGVREPNYFENMGLRFGYVRKADGFKDLPIAGRLGKYDVKVGEGLWVRAGRSDKTVSLVVQSLCYSVGYVKYSAETGFVPVVSFHVALDPAPLQPGDSGSPVYVLRLGQSGYVAWAYGILSGKEAFYNIVLRTIVAPIDFIYVKVSK